MKAKVKSSGEIVEVEKNGFGSIYSASDGNHYFDTDLDFNLDPPHPKATISGWVCRDEDGTLCLFSQEPKRGMEDWFGYYVTELPMDSFLDITWKSEPRKCKITITLEEE